MELHFTAIIVTIIHVTFVITWWDTAATWNEPVTCVPAWSLCGFQTVS